MELCLELLKQLLLLYYFAQPDFLFSLGKEFEQAERHPHTFVTLGILNDSSRPTFLSDNHGPARPVDLFKQLSGFGFQIGNRPNVFFEAHIQSFYGTTKSPAFLTQTERNRKGALCAFAVAFHRCQI